MLNIYANTVILKIHSPTTQMVIHILHQCQRQRLFRRKINMNYKIKILLMLLEKLTPGFSCQSPGLNSLHLNKECSSVNGSQVGHVSHTVEVVKYNSQSWKESTQYCKIWDFYVILYNINTHLWWTEMHRLEITKGHTDATSSSLRANVH